MIHTVVQYHTTTSYDGVHDHNIAQLQKFKENPAAANMKVTTILIRLDDESEFELIEKPEMTPTQLIADVGGMAGFMLGMSVATVLAFVDTVLSAVCYSLYMVFYIILSTFRKDPRKDASTSYGISNRLL